MRTVSTVARSTVPSPMTCTAACSVCQGVGTKFWPARTASSHQIAMKIARATSRQAATLIAPSRKRRDSAGAVLGASIMSGRLCRLFGRRLRALRLVIIVPHVRDALDLRHHVLDVPFPGVEHRRKMEQEDGVDVQGPELGKVPSRQSLALLRRQIEALEHGILLAAESIGPFAVDIDVVARAVELVAGHEIGFVPNSPG